jgi:hypothetical protein
MTKEFFDRLNGNGPTTEQVMAAKEKYNGNVRIATVPLDDTGSGSVDILLKVPARQEIGDFQKWSDSAPTKAREILINACCLSNKEEVLADDFLFYTVSNAISGLFPIGQAKIKNC